MKNNEPTKLIVENWEDHIECQNRENLSKWDTMFKNHK